MGFFAEYDTTRTPTQEVDFLYARVLASAVWHQVNRTYPISITKWAVAFTRMRDVDRLSQTRVEEALLWYVEHIKDPYVPIANCAQSFRAKFLAIEGAMQRWLKDNPTVTIGPEARQTATRLGRRHWPKGSKAQLPLVCQQSLDSYRAFAATVRQTNGVAAAPPALRATVEGLCRHIRSKLSDPAYFVEEWFLAVNDNVAKWDAWTGDLRTFIFRPDHKLFQRMGRDWAQRYCSRPEMWDVLMESIRG